MQVQTKPKRVVSQAPLKAIACAGGCGAEVTYRTNSKVYCSACRLRQKRESARIAADKQRRKRGVQKVKGRTATCTRCGVLFELNRNAHASRCRGCGIERQRERARIVVAAKKGIPGARAYDAAWFKRKRQTDPVYAVNFRMRAAVRRSLKGGKLGRKWEALVGYASVDLMQHLQRQFLPGMTWANRGDWEIDHIIPLAAFNFEAADDPEFRAAWALTNLRPLWAQDNRAKNAHRTHLI